jgi:6-phosphofructokinase 1
VAIASDALDRVHTTAASHHRVMVVEVMGRNSGWIALHAGVSSGADVILIPEVPFTIENVCGTIRARRAAGKHFSILCVSEGARPVGGTAVVARTDPTSPDPIRLGGIGKAVADTIEDITGIESRYVVLGHVQRGGTPVPGDRVLATQLGHQAMALALAGKKNRMVAVQAGRFTDVSITECAGKQRTIARDEPLLLAAREIGIGFGD